MNFNSSKIACCVSICIALILCLKSCSLEQSESSIVFSRKLLSYETMDVERDLIIPMRKNRLMNFGIKWLRQDSVDPERVNIEAYKTDEDIFFKFIIHNSIKKDGKTRDGWNTDIPLKRIYKPHHNLDKPQYSYFKIENTLGHKRYIYPFYNKNEYVDNVSRFLKMAFKHCRGKLFNKAEHQEWINMGFGNIMGFKGQIINIFGDDENVSDPTFEGLEEQINELGNIPGFKTGKYAKSYKLLKRLTHLQLVLKNMNDVHYDYFEEDKNSYRSCLGDIDATRNKFRSAIRKNKIKNALKSFAKPSDPPMFESRIESE